MDSCGLDRELIKKYKYRLPVHVRTDEELGRGSYGAVLVGEIEGGVCAVKKIHDTLAKQPKGKRWQQGKFLKECQIMTELRHPHIVQFFGICEIEGCHLPGLVTEKLLIDLHNLLNPEAEVKPDIPLDLKFSILHDVANGLHFLHSLEPPIIHRDLTARNVLLTSAMVAKIADLGMARILSDQSTLTEAPGNSLYMPPEAIGKDCIYAKPIDVFSFGVLILLTITQIIPNPESTKNAVGGKLIALTEVQRRRAYIERIPDELAPIEDMIKKCLDDDPEQRPEVKTIRDDLESQKGEMSRLELLQALMDVESKKDKYTTENSEEFEAKEERRRYRGTRRKEISRENRTAVSTPTSRKWIFAAVAVGVLSLFLIFIVSPGDWVSHGTAVVNTLCATSDAMENIRQCNNSLIVCKRKEEDCREKKLKDKERELDACQGREKKLGRKEKDCREKKLKDKEIELDACQGREKKLGRKEKDCREKKLKDKEIELDACQGREKELGRKEKDCREREKKLKDKEIELDACQGRENELGRKEKDCREREKKLKEKEIELDACQGREKKLGRKEKDCREKKLKDKEIELDACQGREKELGRKEKDCREREKKLKDKEIELDACQGREKELGRKEKDCREREKKLKDKEIELDACQGREKELGRKEKDCREREKKLKEKEIELDACQGREKKLGRKEKDCREKKLKDKEIELDACQGREKELGRKEKDCREREKKLKDKEIELDACQGREKELGRKEKDCREREKKLKDKEIELDACQGREKELGRKEKDCRKKKLKEKELREKQDNQYNKTRSELKDKLNECKKNWTKEIEDCRSAYEKLQMSTVKDLPKEKKDISVMIIGSILPESKQSVPQKPILLSDEDRKSLSELGLPQHKWDNLNALLAISEKSETDDVVAINISRPRMELSYTYVLKQIKIFLRNGGAALHYYGNGGRNTGDWCFYDGCITFNNIAELYMKCRRRKRLSIVSDCHSSGQWIAEAAKYLDNRRVKPCGHSAREEGILWKIFASSRAGQDSTELLYTTRAMKIKAGGIKYVPSKQLGDAQKTTLLSVVDLNCGKGCAKNCTYAQNGTWLDAVKQHYMCSDGQDCKAKKTKKPKDTAVMIIGSITPPPIISGWTSNYPSPDVVSQLPTTQLSDEDRQNLTNLGLPQYQWDNLNVLMAIYNKTDKNGVVSVYISRAGMELSHKDILEQIKLFLRQHNHYSVIVLHYYGNGGRNTGDWCFNDGCITFYDIAELYMKYRYGKHLFIVSDCHSSGQWIAEAAKYMDNKGATPCEHLSREEGILWIVRASSRAGQDSTELLYTTRAMELMEGTVYHTRGIPISNTQKTTWFDFTRLTYCVSYQRTDWKATVKPFV